VDIAEFVDAIVAEPSRINRVTVAEYKHLLGEESKASKNIGLMFNKLQREKAPTEVIQQVLQPFIEHYKEVSLFIRDCVIIFEPLAVTENDEHS
jgi:hypothetical protein